jgi:4-hydroxythreonine-4-phosphate dehydrogenase
MSGPRIALTVGDVAGIGPEVVVRACSDPKVRQYCRPTVIGNVRLLEQAAAQAGVHAQIVGVEGIDDGQCPAGAIPCWDPVGDSVLAVQQGQIDATAGDAAYAYLVTAAHAVLAGEAEALTTAPLNKAALQRAGHHFPGHTEILAELCRVPRFAMMLYLPAGDSIRSPQGLGVAHVTLHTSIASVPGLLSATLVNDTIELLDQFMRNVDCAIPRIGVCSLNPHAGESGLFGDEEHRIIAPAVEAARSSGITVSGPLPADAVFRLAAGGEFDAVAAMYHDQGHIALKLIGFDRAVNITLGLPIIRTSPSHGTAFDIAGRGIARADGLQEALRIAALLASKRSVANKRYVTSKSPGGKLAPSKQ